ncbi:TRAP transporter substrate-binding protein [Roseofilum capinflatum]|uniref:TRAP transporter substrate-binding protein DctP n=1 Tax=Roseofilum capinflatum BLCC-M114 TaxID=3022440 RepID=A0ABT7BB21_9CYAN|nr:TRAP transporter substrate-binding protein DctP [Roseofilum capinflatum]MDJ1175508.1 TRAP transporter substrate-binding protein DctP [Roseofilum capinflatum BLCC-M114]
MKRRNLLNKIALGAASTYTITACQSPNPPEPTPEPTPSQPLIRWRMATSWPKSLDIIFGAAEILCRRVEQMTEGRFSITPYPANEIISPLQILDGVIAGTVECGHTNLLFSFDRNPALGLISGLPFGMNLQQHNAWFYYGGGLEAMEKIYQGFGVNAFPAGNTGLQMGGWFNRKINTVDDLKGLKMRIPGLGGKILERLGCEVQVLPGDEIFPALEQGKIDAAEWIGPYDDEKLGLNRIAPYYYYPGWWEPSSILIALVNRTQWEQLPKSYQEIFRSAAREAYFLTISRYDAANGEALERMVLSGTELLPYSQDILEDAYPVALELYQEYASDSEDFARIYQQWKQFQSSISNWYTTNQLTYSSFRSGIDPIN